VRRERVSVDMVVILRVDVLGEMERCGAAGGFGTNFIRPMTSSDAHGRVSVTIQAGVHRHV